MSLLFGRNNTKKGNEERAASATFGTSWEEFQRNVLTRRSSSDISSDANTLLTHSAVYSCADLLADVVSEFPAERYRKNDPKRGAELVTGGANLVEDPSEESVIDAVNWRRLLVFMWLMRGYAPGIVTGVNPRHPHIPRGIELIHPDRVSFYRQRADSPWKYLLDEKEVQLWPRGRLWIANGKMMWPSDPVGRSVLEYAAIEAGLGMYARKFANDYFKGGGHPTAVLKNEKTPAQQGEYGEDAIRKIKQRFMDALNGGREPVVMTNGWEYERIQIRPDESQFLSTINANRLIVCNFFRVPPQTFGISAEGSGGNITYSNQVDRDLDMLKYTIQPWITRMESVLDPLTLRNEYVKLNVDELLRADTKRRYESHSLAIRGGWKSVNEVRNEEDLEPIEGGDQYLWPPNRANPTLEEMQGDPDQGENLPVTPPTLLPSPTDPSKVSQPPEEEDEGGGSE